MSDQRTRNRIKSLKVEEVSLVDRPANSAARFVLAKRDNAAHPASCKCKDCKESYKMKKSAAAEVEEEVTDEELDALEAELGELENELELNDDDEEYDEDESYDDEEDFEEDDVVSEYEPEDEDEDEAASEEVGKTDSLIHPMVVALQKSISSIVEADADEQSKQEALSKTISQFEAEAKRLIGEAETVTKSDEEEENTMSGISAQLEKRLTDLHDRNVELEKKLNEVTEARDIEKREAEARAVLGKGAPAAEVTRLAGILKSASAEDAEFIKKMAKKTSELQKSARVFDEIGSSRGESVGAATAVDQMAQELQKNDPKLTRAQAITKAYEALGDEAYLGIDED